MRLTGAINSLSLCVFCLVYGQLAGFVSVSLASTVKLSNVALPTDQHGEKLITGEADVSASESYAYSTTPLGSSLGSFLSRLSRFTAFCRSRYLSTETLTFSI